MKIVNMKSTKIKLNLVQLQSIVSITVYIFQEAYKN